MYTAELRVWKTYRASTIRHTCFRPCSSQSSRRVLLRRCRLSMSRRALHAGQWLSPSCGLSPRHSSAFQPSSGICVDPTWSSCTIHYTPCIQQVDENVSLPCYVLPPGESRWVHAMCISNKARNKMGLHYKGVRKNDGTDRQMDARPLHNSYH